MNRSIEDLKRELEKAEERDFYYQMMDHWSDKTLMAIRDNDLKIRELREEINRQESIKKFNIYGLQEFIDELPTADVVERSEYERLQKENKELKRIVSDKVDEDLKCAFELKELRSKIDKAIEEIDNQYKWLMQTKHTLYDIDIAFESIKYYLRNIGGEVNDK